MPSRVLWSSDHHFGHRAILDERMSLRRPFASIEEHDETLIANWNAAVRPDDTVVGVDGPRTASLCQAEVVADLR